MNTNAKAEFLKHTTWEILKCAMLWREEYLYDEDAAQKIIILPIDFSEQQYQEFLTKLDFNYNSGYGGQELYGTIWNTDGTWLERGEYDGSEWWELKVMPEIPKECYII